MPFQLITPVIDYNVRNLCCLSYAGHTHGCPNFGKRSSCPPGAPLFDDYFDISEVWAIWNCFDFGRHLEIMHQKHPKWTIRQLANCLYWQGTARKQLKQEIKRFCSEMSGWSDANIYAVDGDLPGPARLVTMCPEAMGINVTATMKSINVYLQWPPITTAIQVALAARRKNNLS